MEKFRDSMKEPLMYLIPDSMKEWVPVFHKIWRTDQKYRVIDITGLFEKKLQEQNKLDSVNQKIISGFLDKYGYPEAKQVGIIGTKAIRNVLQHSPLAMQEKYFPLMAEAYKKKPVVMGEYLGMLEDRINMRRNRQQYYGTQLIYYKNSYTLYPVVNVDSLDTYRKKMGFTWTTGEYLKQFDVKWEPEEYKKILPDLIMLYKVTDTIGLHFVK